MRERRLGKMSVVGTAVAGLSFAAVLAHAGAAADLTNGKTVYVDKCARCHGNTGKGDGRLSKTFEKKPGDYTDKNRMEGFTDAQLKEIALEGKPPMPAYKGRITEKDLDDVIAYIRTLAQ